MLGVQGWSQILCHDITFIVSWFNKDDFDDSIFNIQNVAYVYMFAVSNSSDIVGHENSTKIVNTSAYSALVEEQTWPP